MILITPLPIDVPAALAALEDPEVGGVATFMGTVRRHNHGREVMYLDYEAYPEMAEYQLRELATEMKRRWPLERVVLIHRTGRLGIGEMAVFVGVGAAHREEALQACRFGIEFIKQHVPIWKKEVFVGGEAWVECCHAAPQPSAAHL